jgi:hypothetical protein
LHFRWPARWAARWGGGRSGRPSAGRWALAGSAVDSMLFAERPEPVASRYPPAGLDRGSGGAALYGWGG